MLSTYRAYRVMLNVNSVATSPTMFSRRVFESLACGTPVVSSASAGMEAMLGEHVRVARTREDALRHLGDLLGDEAARHRLGHRAFRHIHREHTYAHRLDEVLRRTGVERSGPRDWPRVSVLLATNRPHFIAQAIDNVRRQTYPNLELRVILNSSRFDVSEVERMAADISGARVFLLGESHSLGQCLNAGLDQSTGDYVAKMDDDDLYGEEFLWDLVLAARYSSADVTGKGTYHTYFSGLDQMALRTVSPEHEFTLRGLAGGTLLAARRVFDTVRFQTVPRGTDTRFLYDCQAEGFTFYSADRYNYIMVRQSSPDAHTWQVQEREMLWACQDIRKGLVLTRAMV
jgi:hypothetical protein